jgi:hypothetical protein
MVELFDQELEQLLALDGAAGPARPIAPARAASIVATALRGAGFPPPGTGGGGGGAGGVHGAGRALAPRLIALAGGVSAIAVVAWLAVRAPGAPPSAPVAQTAPPPAAPAQLAPAPAAAAPSEPDPIEMVPDDPPRVPAPSKPHVTAPPTHRRRLPPHASTVAVPVAPEDLLAEANAARLARDWRGADELYARVAAADGAALAMQTALVASAQLHLEHLGDPGGAARRFRRALDAGARDALAEEARWGIAEAARATGDPAGERRALDDFLTHHAGSVRAAQARARRAELEAAL